MIPDIHAMHEQKESSMGKWRQNTCLQTSTRKRSRANMTAYMMELAQDHKCT